MINLLNNQYLKNKTSVKFIIIKKQDFDVNTIESIFLGLLDNIKIIDVTNAYLIIYTNKEYVEFRDFYNSISFDLGYSFNFFEGIKLKTKKIGYLNELVALYNKYIYSKQNDYYSIRDIILKCNDEELELVSDIIYEKEDLNDFKKFASGLFECDLNVSKASKVLYMHRNTINNKIDNFKNETGLRLSRFNDAVVVYRLCKLHIDSKENK